MNETVDIMDNALVETPTESLSPYDPSYPAALLSDGLRKQLMQAEIAAEKIYREIVKDAPVAAQIKEATRKGFRLVVDATDSTLDAIEKGKIKLTVEKTGKTYAQIRDSNGHYGSKLPIKRETFAKGVDPVQMAYAMQMRAIQEQMQQISDQITVIDHSVREVIQGQQNDRFGQYYSGLSLYLEACKVSSPELKSALIAQSLRALADSTFQLKLKMRDDIRYLADRRFNQERKAERVKALDSRMQSIERSFEFIHQASMLRAAIYCNTGELPAMSAVLSEYSGFISGTIAKNADLLAQCDKADSGTETGIWKGRKNLELDVTELVQQLEAPETTLYLGMSQEEEEE